MERRNMFNSSHIAGNQKKKAILLPTFRADIAVQV